MAHLKTIRLGKTYNDGNYESTRIDIEVDLYEGEDANGVFEDMLDQIDTLRRTQSRQQRK